VNFNPDQVKEYRLLGFDNKVGAIKDFDATVEGGEIGPGYSAMIAFEILPTRPFMDKAATAEVLQPAQFSLRYKDPDTHKPQLFEQNPKVHYETLARVSNCYRFASAVMMFGSVLRKSKFAKDISWNDILQVATPAADPQNYSQSEFLAMVQRARLVYSKKRKKEKE
jgi:Ca-activated chloride channel family protein